MVKTADFGNSNDRSKFRRLHRDMGIQEVLSAPRCPWRRAYVVRVIGSIRRECLDHMIVFNEASLYHQHVKVFVSYYHHSRTHLSLAKDTPETHRVRTWSPRGEPPVLQYNFNWDTLSAVAGITFYSFYFRLYKRTVKSAEVVDFLQALLRHLPGPLLIVWDRLSAHRSRITRDFIAGQGQRLWVEYLGYAPERNPVEYIWGYWKQHALPNVCPKDY